MECIFCGSENFRPKSAYCSRICEKRHRRKTYKESGRCMRCGSDKDTEISICSSCLRDDREYYLKNKRARNMYEKNKREEAKKNGLCTMCQKEPPTNNRLTCNSCHNRAVQSQAEYRHKEEYPKSMLLSNAKARAKQFNITFDLDIDDIVIPEVCPILGIRLKAGKKNHLPSSPSLDRIIPELGYVRGNVCVISHKANQMKSDLTKETLLRLLSYIGT